jgi:uncharacterized protein (DUF1330 family)
MAAYLLFLRDEPVKDAEAMAEYSKTARAAGGDVPAKPLIAYGAIEALEGEPVDGVVVMQFENADDARRWYEREGYQAAIPHRKRAAHYRVMLVQGL